MKGYPEHIMHVYTIYALSRMFGIIAVGSLQGAELCPVCDRVPHDRLRQSAEVQNERPDSQTTRIINLQQTQ